MDKKKLDGLRKGLKNVRETVQEELDSKNVNGAITGLRPRHDWGPDEPHWGSYDDLDDIY